MQCVFSAELSIHLNVSTRHPIPAMFPRFSFNPASLFDWRRLLAGVGLLLVSLASLSARPHNFHGGWLNQPVVVHVDTSGMDASKPSFGPQLYASIARAAAEWNNAVGINLIFVTPSAPIPDSVRRLGDGITGIYFSTHISPSQAFGTQFGYTDASRAPNGLFIESDIIFNSNQDWSVYDGPLHYSSDGSRVAEIHRVALHEFGHFLDISHPPDDSYDTIMRSRMNDLYSLQPEDLYDAKLVASAIRFWNQPKIKRFSRSASRFVVKGSSNVYFTRKLVVKFTCPSGQKTIRIRVRNKLSVRIPIPAGATDAALYSRMQGQHSLHFLRRKKL
jgi:hypothetical protein